MAINVPGALLIRSRCAPARMEVSFESTSVVGVVMTAGAPAAVAGGVPGPHKNL